MATPRVQFVYTGGTLGMIASPDGLAPAADVEAEVAAKKVIVPGVVMGSYRSC